MVGKKQKQRGADCKSGVASEEDVLARKSISSVSSHKKQQYPRQKLRHSDIAEIEWAMCDLEYLPPDGNRLHLRGGDRQKTRGLVQPKIAIPERHSRGSLAG